MRSNLATVRARLSMAATLPMLAGALALGIPAAHAADHPARGRPAGLAAYAKAVADPSSPMYGKYLSAKQTQARFGATKAQVAAVKSWLKSAGLKVTSVTPHYIAVSGDVAAAEKAFGTQLHNFAKG